MERATLPRTAHGAAETLHEIVVVGGGAGGLELVTALGNTLGRRRQAAIGLVERSRTHLWKPLLHAVAAGSLDRDEHETGYLAQAHWHHFRYHLGEMVGLDRAARAVHLAETRDEDGRQITPPRAVRYDTLVIAIGSIVNDFGTPGVAEFAVPLDTPRQAARFHRRLLDACLRANAQEGPIRPGQLHVAIIGGGATGTELAAELYRTAREVVAFGLDRIDPERDIRIMLLEAAPRILPALPERIADETLGILQKLGVEVHSGARVSEVTQAGVRLADGTFLDAELVVWAAGVKAPDDLRDLGGLETNHANQLVVRQTLQTTRDDAIFAMGDCAACPWPGHDGPVPPRAQAAHQQASYLARQLPRRLRGLPVRPYAYRDFGSLVSLGRYTTVGNLMGLTGRNFFIEGLFARLVYRSLYKGHEVALHGWRRVAVESLGRILARRTEPVVKLH